MDKQTFFEMLDIDTADDFQYFENFADLVESTDDFDSDLIYQLLADIDLNVFGELCENYFDQAEESIPDDQTDFFTLFGNIKRVFLGMIESAIDSDDDVLVILSEEINKFRLWYVEESSVECREQEGTDVIFEPVCDALIRSKMEKLGGKEYFYDFQSALDYPLEEYIMTFADMVDA